MALVPTDLEQSLKATLQTAAQNAFLETFSGYPTEDGDKRNEIATKFANKFASIAAKGIATAVDTYIKSATIMGGLVVTAGGPTSQTGSVSAPLSIT